MKLSNKLEEEFETKHNPELISEFCTSQVNEHQDLVDAIQYLNKTISTLQSYSNEVNKRIQETYDIEFNIDEVIRELNKVQDKIERYIKNKNGFEKNEIVTNTKLEPVEEVAVIIDPFNAKPTEEDGIKLEIDDDPVENLYFEDNHISSDGHYSDDELTKKKVKIKKVQQRKIIKCEICSKKMLEKLLKDHMGYHTGEGMEKCTICDKKHPKAFMAKHMRNRHSSNTKTFQCELCDKSFKSEELLLQHSRIHAGEKIHSCDHCGKSYVCKTNLKTHLLKVHQIGGKQNIKCELCAKMFLTDSQLKVHMRGHTGEKPYPCDLCDKSFRSSGARLGHRRIHTGERPFSCDQCGKTFVQSTHLNTHKKLVHEGQKLKYNAEYYRDKRKDQVGKYICGTCGKLFRSPAHLKTHEFLHTGEKPFKCEFCDKSFAQLIGLKSHLEVHKTTKDYECDQCGKKYKTSNSFTNHVRDVHTNKHIKIPCTLCNMEFTKKCNMMRHIKDVHEGVKRAKCEVCGQAFVSNTVLKQHMRVHTGEKPYQCEICSKAFTQQSSLYSHKKKSCIQRESIN